MVHAKQECDTIALLGEVMSTSSNCVLAFITVSTISSMMTKPCLMMIIFLKDLRTLTKSARPAIGNRRVSSSVPPVPDTNKTPPSLRPTRAIALVQTIDERQPRTRAHTHTHTHIHTHNAKNTHTHEHTHIHIHTHTHTPIHTRSQTQKDHTHTQTHTRLVAGRDAAREATIVDRHNINASSKHKQICSAVTNRQHFYQVIHPTFLKGCLRLRDRQGIASLLVNVSSNTTLRLSYEARNNASHNDVNDRAANQVTQASDTSDSLVRFSNKCVSANVTKPCELKGPVDHGVYKNPHKHDGKLHHSICLKCSVDIHA